MKTCHSLSLNLCWVLLKCYLFSGASLGYLLKWIILPGLPASLLFAIALPPLVWHYLPRNVSSRRAGNFVVFTFVSPGSRALSKSLLHEQGCENVMYKQKVLQCY